MGALITTVLALARAGDHIVAQRGMFGGSASLLQQVRTRVGFERTLADWHRS
jgi:methionine-gamma-lyase